MLQWYWKRGSVRILNKPLDTFTFPSVQVDIVVMTVFCADHLITDQMKGAHRGLFCSFQAFLPVPLVRGNSERSADYGVQCCLSA